MSVLAVALPLAKGRAGLEHILWDAIAYAGRYGKQPATVCLAMTLSDLRRFNNAVSNIVKEENKPREGHGH